MFVVGMLQSGTVDTTLSGEPKVSTLSQIILIPESCLHPHKGYMWLSKAGPATLPGIHCPIISLSLLCPDPSTLITPCCFPVGSASLLQMKKKPNKVGMQTFFWFILFPQKASATWLFLSPIQRCGPALPSTSHQVSRLRKCEDAFSSVLLIMFLLSAHNSTQCRPKELNVWTNIIYQ